MPAMLKCPKCGQSDRFIADCFVEYHTAVIDNQGTWVEDVECFDSKFGEGCRLECSACGHSDDFSVFEQAAKTTASQNR